MFIRLRVQCWSDISQAVEQDIPALISPWKHQFNNNIKTKIPLKDFQIPVKKLQYPRQHKAKKSCSEMVKKKVSLYQQQFLHQGRTDQPQENTLSWNFSWSGSGVGDRGASKVLAFWKEHLRDSFLSCLTLNREGKRLVH